MPVLNKILLFIIANTLGFLTVGLCFYIGVETQALDLSDPAFDVEDFKSKFILGTMAAWMAAALMSLAWFLTESRIRFVFLCAPVIAPLAYGLSVLYISPP